MKCRDSPCSLSDTLRSTIARASRHPLLLRLVICCGLLKGVAAASLSSGAVCSSSSSSSRRLQEGRRLGAGAPWYCDDYEKDHIEAISAAAMIVVAIAFEHVYHEMHHRAEHAFVYGQSMLSHHEREALVVRGSLGKPLRLMLFVRASGEFMVLGFLAFTIWTCNQQGVFDEIAEISIEIRTPTSGVDYLHLMEEVHMQLFVANVLYFALCFMITLRSDKRIQDFEWCRTEWVKQLLECDSVMGKVYDGGNDRGLQAFKYGRGHFLAQAVPEILHWQTMAPVTFDSIMRSMKLDKPQGTVTLDDLKMIFTDRFSFCSYLVFNVCYDTIHMIDMGTWTMLSIVLIKLVLAAMHRWGKVSKSEIMPWMNLICLLSMVAIYVVTRLFKKSMSKEEIEPIPGLSWLPGLCKRISVKVDAGMVLLCTLQVLLFFLCHSWAGYMIDKNYWNAIFQDGYVPFALMGCAFIIALIALAYFLPRVIPDYSQVMSLPPFFSYSNQKMIQHVAIQVVDAKMVAAREALKKKLEQKKAKEEAAGHDAGIIPGATGIIPVASMSDSCKDSTERATHSEKTPSQAASTLADASSEPARDASKEKLAVAKKNLRPKSKKVSNKQSESNAK